jgi:hypothetical protein
MGLWPQRLHEKIHLGQPGRNVKPHELDPVVTFEGKVALKPYHPSWCRYWTAAAAHFMRVLCGFWHGWEHGVGVSVQGACGAVLESMRCFEVVDFSRSSDAGEVYRYPEIGVDQQGSLKLGKSKLV